MAANEISQSFKVSPAWVIQQQGKLLRISGGADALYEIELETDEPSFFAENTKTPFTRKQLTALDQQVLEELLTAEIVVPVLRNANHLRFVVLGDTTTLKLTGRNSDPKTADLAVVVRAHGSFASLLKELDYQNLHLPHLFVDMAYHHTVSIGPLVFPGETACIACLQGRVGTRWGDEAPPDLPQSAQTYAKVISDLVATELDRIAAGDTSLANKTVSWDFQNRTTKTDLLLKVPLCPMCGQNKIDRSGALALPWTKQ